MKQSLKKFITTCKNLSGKIIFCSQVGIIIVALPLLYMVGVSYNMSEKKTNQVIIMTNKGKKIIVTTSQSAYSQDNKRNNFALYISNGQASFPTTVIIPAENTEPIPVPGLLEPKELEPILKYFGEGAYKASYPQFQKTFHSSW
jgi:hypothetical protein